MNALTTLGLIAIIAPSCSLAQVGSAYPGYFGKTTTAIASGTGYSSGFAVGYSGVKWRTYLSGIYCGIGKERTTVITSASDWQAYWKELHAGESPMPDCPTDIKWASEMLVAINLGTRNTGGYSLTVDSVKTPAANKIAIVILEEMPSPDLMTTDALTSLYTIIRMPRLPGKISFTKRQVVAKQQF